MKVTTEVDYKWCHTQQQYVPCTHPVPNGLHAMAQSFALSMGPYHALVSVKIVSTPDLVCQKVEVEVVI